MAGLFLRFFALSLLTFHVLVLAAPPAHAQSAQLMQHYRQYMALYKAGKYREAIPHAKRALDLGEREFGTEHGNVGAFLNNLAKLFLAQGRYNEAERLFKRTIEIVAKTRGPKHPDVGTILNNLGNLYRLQGRYGKAEPLFKDSLEIREKALGPDDIDVGQSLNNLALLYQMQGRYFEAEPLYRRSLKITGKALGWNHPDVGQSLNNLAGLFDAQGRYTEAEPLYKRGLNIREKALGRNHPDVGQSLNNLAALFDTQGRYAEAEPLYKRSLNIREKALGRNHPDVGDSLNNLALLFKMQGRYGEAEPLYQRSLKIKIKVLGRNHPDVGASLNNLAALFDAQGRYFAAELLYRRSLKILEKALGRNHPDVATTLNNFAFLYFLQSDWRQSAAFSRRATGILTRRDARSRQIDQGVGGKKKNEATRSQSYFQRLVKSIYRLERKSGHAGETFMSAQWAMGSQAAGALAQMSARQSAGSGELATMVRERQDSVRAWQQKEKRMNSLRGAGKSDETLEAQMAKLDQRIAKIDNRLTKDFPDYAALASPKPLSIKQVQKLLGKDEALILLLDTPKVKPTPAETFIWAVTRDKAVWKRAELGGKGLRDKIALLRKELDPSTATRSAKSKRGFAPLKESAGFSLDTAHELYTKLLGPVEGVIKDKSHLMVVGSGPLTALPFQVLLKTKPQFYGEQKYQKADWLVRHHAITTLPSVSSLQALRGIAKTASRAPRPLIGFADPVFSHSKKVVRMASIEKTKRGYASFFRGGKVNLASLAALASLPGTRRELQEIGEILKVADQHLHFGVAASERAVKAAKLDRYRIVYFATHGLVSGDVQGLGEPALAFSLPDKASAIDDGLLTASEVTQLKLNADWLVMSACNTASGDKPGAEALSGLARAFFYAGAKTLLVSHWPVGDEAAVALTTHAFMAMQKNPKLGKSQALRRSMLAMIDKGELANAHPSVWAPFVVVGEGGARR